MVEIGSGSAGFLAGCIASCGALLVVAGVSKIYRGARGATGDTAVRRALRVPLRRWRRAEPAIGALECAVGVAVATGVYPVAGGAAMAALGAAFCALLGYARVKRVPGGCGCVAWRTPAAQRVSWPEIVRSAMLLGAGLAAAVLQPGAPGAVNRAWFGAGVLAGGAVLALLSLPTPLRTPVCHRPIWRPARATLRALTGHPVFAAMADSAGPFGPVLRYRQTGCTEEFWFTAACGSNDARGEDRAVVFRVRHTAPGGTLAVQASMQHVAATMTHDVPSYQS